MHNFPKEILEAIELMDAVVDYVEEECWYDHHGYCQAHSLLPNCPFEKMLTKIENLKRVVQDLLEIKAMYEDLCK